MFHLRRSTVADARAFRRASVLAVVLALTAVGAPAHAQFFAEVPPASCNIRPGFTQLDYDYDYNKAFRAYMVKSPWGTYGNNIDLTRELAGNGYVHRIAYYFAPFDTEPTDVLEIGRADAYGGTVHSTWSGSLGYSAPWAVVDVSYHHVPPPPYGDWYESFPAYLNWATDSTNWTTRPGFTVGTVKACTQPSIGWLNTAHHLLASERIDGMLMGSGDVVYFYTGNGNETIGHNIVVGPLGSESNDIDVYVRCGAKPNQTSYYDRGFTTGSEEFIHIPPSDNFCKGQGMYIAVHAWYGKGTFYLIYSKVKPEHIHSVVTVGSDYTVDKNDIKDSVEEAGRMLYDFTEGQMLIEEFHYYHNQNCKCPTYDCDICFSSGSYAPHPDDYGHCPDVGWDGDEVGMYRSCTDSRILAHEMAHCFFNQVDEYEYATTGRHQCGYTIMAMSPTYWDPPNTLCVAHNHRLDKHPDASYITWPHGWSRASQVYWVPTKTPDPTIFLAPKHPMGDYIKYLEK